MRFISKSSNLLVVLRAGLSAQPITGTPAKPTISVRFRDGIVDVSDQELIDLMLTHPGYEGDFISAESVHNVDPYAGLRQESEPQHVVTELVHGQPMGRRVTGKTQLPPELARLVHDSAAEIAKAMLPGMVEEVLKSLVKDREAKPAAAKTAAKKRGRPARAKVEEVISPLAAEEVGAIMGQPNIKDAA